MTDGEAKRVEESLAGIGVHAKVRNICARCEEPIGRKRSVVCEFAPYAGLRLHATCLARLVGETVEAES